MFVHACVCMSMYIHNSLRPRFLKTLADMQELTLKRQGAYGSDPGATCRLIRLRGSYG